MPLLWQSGLSNQRYLMLGYIPVKGPDMVRGLSAGKQDYIVSINQNYTNTEPKSVFTISICIF